MLRTPRLKLCVIQTNHNPRRFSDMDSRRCSENTLTEDVSMCPPPTEITAPDVPKKDLAANVQRYVRLHEAPLLAPHECTEIIEKCASILKTETIFIQYQTALYLTSEAFGRAYDEHTRRLLQEYTRVSRAVDGV